MEIDLTKPRQARPVEQSPDLASPRSEPEPEKRLTERVEQRAIVYQRRRAVIESRVMTGADRTLLGMRCVQATGGLYAQMAPMDQWRVRALWRAALQLVEPPEWLLDEMQNDDELLGTVDEWLADHEHRFFRRDAGEGGEAPAGPRVVLAPVDVAAGGARPGAANATRSR